MLKALTNFLAPPKILVPPKVLVIGAGGQVGEALKEILGSSAILVGPELLDLAKPQEAGRRILEMKPEIVINAAAYTQVDQAEKEEALAFTINAEAPFEMAKACYELGASFVTYSTDYVYSGTGVEPWSESSLVNPKNAYGRTKAIGEKLLLDWASADFQLLILRTSWVYSFIGKNFVLTMLKLGAEREELKVVNDQVGAPTYAPHLAQATLDILGRSESLSGVYNCAASGETSWFQFAEEIFAGARELGVDFKLKKLIGISSAEYPTPAARPLNSRLNQTKLLEKFGLRLPHYKLGLDQCLRQIIQREGTRK